MFTFTEAQFINLISPYIWPFIRALALFTAMPLFNRNSVPLRVKIGLAFFTAVALQATLPPVPEVSLNSSLAFLLLIQQIVIGLTIGFAVRIIFAAVEYAGELIGLKMGLNFASFFDPLTSNYGAITTSFFSLIVAWFFIVSNGHLVVFHALTKSFITFPIGQSPWDFLSSVKPWLWASEIFKMGFLISLPLLAVLFIMNIIMGIISKVAPTVQIFAVGFPFTLLVGLVGLWFIIPGLEKPLNSLMERILLTLG